MEILHKDDGKTGVFYIEQAGEQVAEMRYKWDGTSIIIDHTLVNPILGGKGIGKQLVDRAVAFAREKKITIVPICSFVERVLNFDNRYQDVLKK